MVLPGPRPLPEPPKPEPAKPIDPPEGTGGRRRPGRPRNVPDEPGSVPDGATVRRMAREDPRFNVPAPVAKPLRLKTNVMYKQEVVVRFEVKITRVQVATRYLKRKSLLGLHPTEHLPRLGY